ncbi:MAG: putative antitoxin, contains HTH domain [Candidatus Methanocomedens sp.]|nr:MAG: putative antitoxin, contains HTH domain [ANME-2 cluster archaeon]
MEEGGHIKIRFVCIVKSAKVHVKCLKIFLSSQIKNSIMSVISITPSKDIEKKIDLLASEFHLDKAAVVNDLIDIGAQQKLIDFALDKYTKKKVSLGKAAEIAGISIREMLDILNEKEIPLHISKKSILSDFEASAQ